MSDHDDTFDEEDGDMLDDIEETGVTKHASNNEIDARRRLERLREDKELERLMEGVPDDWNDDLYDVPYDSSNDDLY